MLNRNTYMEGVELQQFQHFPQQHHQEQVFPAGFYLAGALDNSAIFNQETGQPFAGGQRPPAKKDRHSKITTAQGPRDRRVRLSISIARKFFDLQEMLGFDKPSKTLDWLLTKSKAAIKDLVQSKQGNDNGNGNSSSSENGADSRRKQGGKDKRASASATPSPAKESRAKARARARERTLEKMCIKQLNGAGESHQKLDFLQLSSGSGGGISTNNYGSSCVLRSEGVSVNQGLKKKAKNPVFGFQQNLVLNSNSMALSANENWDVLGFGSQSAFHAVLDHHKFINSNSNI